MDLALSDSALGASYLSDAGLRAEQEGLVGLAQPRIAQQEEAHVLVVERLRQADEMHADFFRQPVALAPVAGAAAGHEVLPRAQATTRARQDVVERQIALSPPAVLAGL